MRGISAAEMCQLAAFYENEVESVKYAKRARQNGTDDCERSGRPTGANTPGNMIRVENAVFENRILVISELQQDLCLSHGTFVRIIHGLGFTIGKREGVNDGFYPYL
jgi:hypothetical protein